jgi:hypothetical protein
VAGARSNHQADRGSAPNHRGIWSPPRAGLGLCVFITVGPSTKLFTWGGGGEYGRTCATRDDEPRPVWTSLPITHCVCVFITAGPSTCVCLLLQDLRAVCEGCVYCSTVCLLLQDLVQSCLHVFLQSCSRVCWGGNLFFLSCPFGGINVLCDGFQPDPGRRQIRRCVRDERRLAAGSRRIAWCARRRVQIKGAGRRALKNLRSWRAGGAWRAYANPPYIPGLQLPRKAGCGSLAAAGRSALKALG